MKNFPPGFPRESCSIVLCHVKLRAKTGGGGGKKISVFPYRGFFRVKEKSFLQKNSPAKNKEVGVGCWFGHKRVNFEALLFSFVVGQCEK